MFCEIHDCFASISEQCRTLGLMFILLRAFWNSLLCEPQRAMHNNIKFHFASFSEQYITIFLLFIHWQLLLVEYWTKQDLFSDISLLLSFNLFPLYLGIFYPNQPVSSWYIASVMDIFEYIQSLTTPTIIASSESRRFTVRRTTNTPSVPCLNIGAMENPCLLYLLPFIKHTSCRRRMGVL